MNRSKIVGLSLLVGVIVFTTGASCPSRAAADGISAGVSNGVEAAVSELLLTLLGIDGA
ncbi:MAG: hypothetical protein AB7N71_04875 [Phycisphaerae bacterium]